MNDAKDQNSPYVEAYARLLNLVAAVERMPGMEKFDANEKALFEEVLQAWTNRAPLTVRQLISIERLGSPATLHKRLTLLRAMGLVDAVNTNGNRRTKYLSPTAKGLDYVKNLGEACSLVFQDVR